MSRTLCHLRQVDVQSKIRNESGGIINKPAAYVLALLGEGIFVFTVFTIFGPEDRYHNLYVIVPATVICIFDAIVLLLYPFYHEQFKPASLKRLANLSLLALFLLAVSSPNHMEAPHPPLDLFQQWTSDDYTNYDDPRTPYCVVFRSRPVPSDTNPSKYPHFTTRWELVPEPVQLACKTQFGSQSRFDDRPNSKVFIIGYETEAGLYSLAYNGAKWDKDDYSHEINLLFKKAGSAYVFDHAELDAVERNSDRAILFFDHTKNIDVKDIRF